MASFWSVQHILSDLAAELPLVLNLFILLFPLCTHLTLKWNTLILCLLPLCKWFPGLLYDGPPWPFAEPLQSAPPLCSWKASSSVPHCPPKYNKFWSDYTTPWFTFRSLNHYTGCSELQYHQNTVKPDTISLLSRIATWLEYATMHITYLINIKTFVYWRVTIGVIITMQCIMCQVFISKILLKFDLKYFSFSQGVLFRKCYLTYYYNYYIHD